MPYWSAMKIKVNTSHIRLGEGSNAQSCAIALAVRAGVEKAIAQEAKRCRLVGLANDLKTELEDDAVGVDTGYITVKNKSMNASSKIRAFVVNFDALKEAEAEENFDEIKRLRKLVKPFEFTLNLR